MTKEETPQFTFSAELEEKSASGVSASVDSPVPQMTKFQILKNLAVVSLGFLFLFTAFQSMTNLQSSLNKEEGIGTGGLSIIYGALILSSMFLPPFVIAQLGCKWTIPVSMACYVLYMAANFHAIWGLIAPTAVILGIAAAPLWSAKCTYLTRMGVWYAKLTGQSEDAVINKFFGIFFMIFQTSQIWGNLISSTVFSKRPENSSSFLNVTAEVLATCGSNYCPEKEGNSTSKPNEDKIYIVCGLYTGFAVLATVVIAAFLDKIHLGKQDEKAGKISSRLLVATFRHLVSSPAQMMLVILTVYSGIEQAFIAGDFTRSYITCSLGIWNVGYIMIVYGVMDAICSFAFGRLVQYVGHIPFFILAFLVHGGCQIALLLWKVDPDMLYLYYILAALWGMGDAVIQTQINALYGYLFTNNSEAAFANYKLWESIGFIISFAYNNYICTDIKLYVCMGFLVVGMSGYAMVEVMHKKEAENTYDLKSN